MAVLLGLWLWMIIGIFCYTVKGGYKKNKETVKVDSNLVEQLTNMLEEAKKKEAGTQMIATNMIE